MAAAGEIQHSPTQGERGYTLNTALIKTNTLYLIFLIKALLILKYCYVKKNHRKKLNLNDLVSVFLTEPRFSLG